MAGEFAPAVGGHFAVARVQADDDVAAKCGAGVLQKAGVLHRCGADDDVAKSGVQVALYGVQIADTAAQLHIHLAAHFFQNLADGGLIFGVPCKRTVQVHQVQPPCAFVHPAAGHHGGLFAKSGGLVHVALLEANAVAVFEINRRN